MNGTLKSLLALPALWLAGGVTWIFILGGSLAAAGRGSGTPLLVAMGVAWGSALLVSLGVLLAGKVLLWKWLPQDATRVVLLVVLALVQLGTLLTQVFSVFVAFNR